MLCGRKYFWIAPENAATVVPFASVSKSCWFQNDTPNCILWLSNRLWTALGHAKVAASACGMPTNAPRKPETSRMARTGTPDLRVLRIRFHLRLILHQPYQVRADGLARDLSYR